MKMQKQECSKNGGFREVLTLVLTSSKPLTLEPNSFSSFTNGTLRNVHKLKRNREMADIISRLFLNNQLDMRRVVNRVQSFVNEHLNLILCLLYITMQKRV